MSARSCDQLCPITADHMEGTSTLIIRALMIKCALMISVAPAVPPVSALCQCSSVPYVSAHQCQCPSMPHISAHLSCLSVSPISASQCHLSMPSSATYQCCQSLPPISASQCRLSVPVSAAYQCTSVPPNSACQ
ncbi:unnamed protein product, partial [Staurois parvus]